MKHLINSTFQVLLIVSVVACGGGKKESSGAVQTDSAAITDTMAKEKPRLRPQAPIDYMELLETEVFRGRVAKSKDVEDGRAVFAMRPLKGEHKALPLRMPYLVTARSDVHRDTFMVIMQCERIGGDTLVGVRNGWNQYKMMHISDVLCATFITPIPLDAFESSKRPL
jgi:hypothetical protein